MDHRLHADLTSNALRLSIRYNAQVHKRAPKRLWYHALFYRPARSSVIVLRLITRSPNVVLCTEYHLAGVTYTFLHNRNIVGVVIMSIDNDVRAVQVDRLPIMDEAV